MRERGGAVWSHGVFWWSVFWVVVDAVPLTCSWLPRVEQQAGRLAGVGCSLFSTHHQAYVCVMYVPLFVFPFIVYTYFFVKKRIKG